MRTFVMLYAIEMTRCAERKAFTLLASVCSSWYFTLTGWPQSPTPRWVKNQLKKLIERECTST